MLKAKGEDYKDINGNLSFIVINASLKLICYFFLLLLYTQLQIRRADDSDIKSKAHQSPIGEAKE